MNLTMHNSEKDFEKLYDTYSPMLYGIALEISPTKQKAEEILVKTFAEAYKTQIAGHNNESLCIPLIRLIIHIAHLQFNPGQLKHNFRLKLFEDLPLLHILICEQVNPKYHCKKNNLTPMEFVKKLIAEFNLIRKPPPLVILK